MTAPFTLFCFLLRHYWQLFLRYFVSSFVTIGSKVETSRKRDNPVIPKHKISNFTSNEKAHLTMILFILTSKLVVNLKNQNTEIT